MNLLVCFVMKLLLGSDFWIEIMYKRCFLVFFGRLIIHIFLYFSSLKFYFDLKVFIVCLPMFTVCFYVYCLPLSRPVYQFSMFTCFGLGFWHCLHCMSLFMALATFTIYAVSQKIIILFSLPAIRSFINILVYSRPCVLPTSLDNLCSKTGTFHVYNDCVFLCISCMSIFL